MAVYEMYEDKWNSCLSFVIFLNKKIIVTHVLISYQLYNYLKIVSYD